MSRAPLTVEPFAHIDRALAIVRGCLPASEAQVIAALAQHGIMFRRGRLHALAQAAVRAGYRPAFRVVDLGGTRVAVAPNQVSLSKVAYTEAARAVYQWGASSISVIAERIHVLTGTDLGASFVERLMASIDTFAWLDQAEGWFWFTRRPSRLIDDLTAVFSFVPCIPLQRLWHAVQRARAWLVPPPPSVLGRICATMPGILVVGDVVVVQQQHQRPLFALRSPERQVVEILARAGRPLARREIRHLIRAANLPAAVIRRVLQTSPLIEPLASRSFGLLGAA